MHGMTGPLEKTATSYTSKVGSQSSADYDLAGGDLVQKRGDDLSQTGAEYASALYSGDIGKTLALGRRIADLKGYLNAYRASGGAGGMYGGVFGEVMPAVRLSSQSGGADVSHGVDSMSAFHNPKWNIHKPKDAE